MSFHLFVFDYIDWSKDILHQSLYENSKSNRKANNPISKSLNQYFNKEKGSLPNLHIYQFLKYTKNNQHNTKTSIQIWQIVYQGDGVFDMFLSLLMMLKPTAESLDNCLIPAPFLQNGNENSISFLLWER